MARHERPAQVSWMLQIQYQRGGPWSDHTSGLSQLVRVTATFAVEPESRRPS